MRKFYYVLIVLIINSNINANTKMNVFNITDYGAKGDGITLDTKSIQHAIDECFSKGGGTVYFPAGKSFLTGTIYLKSNITLLIGNGAQLLGSNDMKDYTDDTGICPYYPEPLDKCLIYAENANNITIEGQGTINGQYKGDLFKQIEGAEGRDAKQRPMLIRFYECQDIHMRDLMLKGSASWCNHFKYCNNIKLEDLTIFNDRQDGFNIESCEEITISNCNLKCGDDGIALTTSHKDKPLKNMTVTNCIISSNWAAIRLGPLSKGNYENITVSNCVFHNCYGGGIKLGMFEGAKIRNCIFSDIVMDSVTCPIGIFIVRYNEIGTLNEEKELMPAGEIENILFQNMIIKAINRPVPEIKKKLKKQYDTRVHPNWASTIFIHGHPEMDIKNVQLNNIQVTFPGGGTKSEGVFRDMEDMDTKGEKGVWTEHKKWGVMPAYGIYARHISRLEMKNVRLGYIEEDERTPVFIYESGEVDIQDMKAKTSSNAEAFITLRNSEDCRIYNSQPVNNTETFLCVEGAKSNNITLMNNDFRKVETEVKFKRSAVKDSVYLQGNIGNIGVE